jgi:hypothetical protein
VGDEAPTAVPSKKSKYPCHSVSQDNDFIAPVLSTLPSISSLGTAYGKSPWLSGFNVHGIPCAIAVMPKESSLVQLNKDVCGLIISINMSDRVYGSTVNKGNGLL